MYEELVKSLRQCAEASCAGCKNDLVEIGCRGKLQIEAADAIEKLEKAVPRWIPVAEKLPQEWWPVLGLIQFHDEKEPPAQEVLWYLGNGHWRETWSGDMIESTVTHWMPLPEPPKEE